MFTIFAHDLVSRTNSPKDMRDQHAIFVLDEH